MKKRELYAYLAGLIDGEGTITVIRRGKRAFRAHLEIQISERAPLDEISKLLGNYGVDMKIYTQVRDKRKATYKPMSSARILTLKSLNIALPNLIPFLFIKKQQAILLLTFVRRRQRRLRHDYHARFETKDSEICKTIQSMNQNENNGRRGISEI